MSYNVNFENKLPRSKRQKSLISLVIISVIALSTILVIAFFPHPVEKEDDDSSDDDPDFPTIHIICYGDLNTESYSDCIFALESSKSSEDIDAMEAKIKIRGETTATYPKKVIV
ncbi:MAG: hypothetical protein ACFFAO_19775 [Candidatus Hermodarchaeota archaeon]